MTQPGCCSTESTRYTEPACAFPLRHCQEQGGQGDGQLKGHSIGMPPANTARTVLFLSTHRSPLTRITPLHCHTPATRHRCFGQQQGASQRKSHIPAPAHVAIPTQLFNMWPQLLVLLGNTDTNCPFLWQLA